MDSAAQDVRLDPAAALARASRLAADVLQPAAAGVDSTHQVPREHLDLLASQGWYGLAGPRDHGGLDLDFPTACAVVEMLAGACLSTTFVWLQHHGAVRAAASADGALREQWLRPLCLGQRRAGVALTGARPGPPVLQARPIAGGYVLDGFAPWVTGWGYIDTLHTAARDPDDNVVWTMVDVQPGSTLSAEPLAMVALMATGTVEVRFTGHFVPADRVTSIVPLSEWMIRDAAGLRMNGSLALGVAARCCELIGPSPLDGELISARAALDTGTPQTMPAARAAAAELAMRAAAALVVAAGSKAILLDQDAQRLAREALFLLVFGTRPAIKESLTALLTARR